MPGMFLRGLWGDESFRRFAKVRADVARAAKAKRPQPEVVFVFGDKNCDYLQWHRFAAVKLSAEPVVNWTGAGVDRNAVQDWTGALCYGMSSWRHKLEVIVHGIELYGEVVWLDWDCLLHKPIPEDFWKRLRAGKPLQMCPRAYRRPQALWRTEGRNWLPHGAWIYCRDPAIIREVIEIHATMPLHMDEHAFAKWFDTTMGGWQGIHAYKEQGWAPYCYVSPAVPWLPEQFLFHERLSQATVQRLKQEGLH